MPAFSITAQRVVSKELDSEVHLHMQMNTDVSYRCSVPCPWSKPGTGAFSWTVAICKVLDDLSKVDAECYRWK